MNSASKDKIAVGLFALLCIVLYFNSLWNAFIFDDMHMIVDNAYIKSAHFLPLFFRGFVTSFPAPKGMLRPLLMWTFSLNYLFSRTNPIGYHMVNILIHFLNAVLLYCLLRQLNKEAPYGLILILALLFIAHPVNVETVSYISCRSDLLVTLFMVLGTLFYINKRYLLTLLFYSSALLTKETAISFGLLIAFYDFVYDFLGSINISEIKSWIKKKKVFYILLVALTLLYLFYRSALFGKMGNVYPVRSLYSNVLTQSMVSLYYLRLFLWPQPLSVHHALPVLESLVNPLAIISVLGIGVLISLIFIFRKKRPLVSFGLGWILICLAPKFYGTLNIIASEHHFYLPSIGMYLIVTLALQRLFLRFKRQFIYIGATVIGIFAILVGFRNYEWKDGLTLWKSAVKRDTHSATAHHNLGVEYIKAGLYREAEEEFKKVLSLSQTIDAKIDVGMNLANIYKRQGKFKETIDELNKVQKLKPDYFGIFNELGIAYVKIGEPEKAVKIWEEGLRLYPRYANLYTNLGLLYLMKDNLREAEDYFRSALKYDPDSYLAYFGLGQVMERRADFARAIKFYEKSIQLNPAYASSHYTLGTLYAKNGDSRALRELKEAVRLEPFFAPAHNNLAIVYASMEPPRVELARQHAQRALALGYQVNEELLRQLSLK